MNIMNGSIDAFIERAMHTRTDKTPHSLLSTVFNRLLQLIDDIFAYLSTEYVKRRELIHKRVADLSKQDNHPLSPVVEKVKNVIQDKEGKSKEEAPETVLDKPKAKEKKIAPQILADDKKTSSQPDLRKLHVDKKTDVKDTKKTLHDLFEQGLHEDEILAIVADGMPEQDARTILTQLKKEKEEKEQSKKAVPNKEKKITPQILTDDKKTSSQPDLGKLHLDKKADQEDTKKTLHDLFEQGLHEDEILAIVAHGMPEQDARTILTQLKKEKEEKEQPKKAVPNKEKKIAPQIPVEDKKASSQPDLGKLDLDIQIDLEDTKKTLHDLFEQGLHEDEILAIVSGGGMPEQDARTILTQLKKEKEKKEQPKKAIPDIAKIEKKKAPQNQVKYPTLVLAAHGVNQYQAGGPAACTPLACAFIASKLPVSSEMIEKLILSNKYDKDTFAETENCIGEAHLKVAQNPWDFQRDFGPTLQVSFERQGPTGLSAAVKSLSDEKGIGGAIITGNGVTIAMRKQGNTLEFFDSHGDAALTGKGNAAYVQTFTNDQKELMVGLLEHRFPNIGFAPNIEIWPIQS